MEEVANDPKSAKKDRRGKRPRWGRKNKSKKAEDTDGPSRDEAAPEVKKTKTAPKQEVSSDPSAQKVVKKPNLFLEVFR